VVDGKCERCGTLAEKREKEQWMLAITKYAERLDKDLDTVDYPDRVKTQQRNWIGKSEGALIKFDDIEVFTTRPDTIFGATFLVVAGKQDKFYQPCDKRKNPCVGGGVCVCRLWHRGNNGRAGA
jgi:leucyl-tRNA synthetase